MRRSDPPSPARLRCLPGATVVGRERTRNERADRRNPRAASPDSTINRPERRNAMSWEVIRALRQAVRSVHDDPDVSVVVLTGAGDEAFCSGADLGSMGHGTATGADADGQRRTGSAATPRLPRPARGTRRARRAVRADVGPREADDRKGSGLGDGWRVRPCARLRHGGRLGKGPVRCAGGERRAVALHDHGPARAFHAAQEGAGADAHRPGGGAEEADASGSSRGSSPTTSWTRRWTSSRRPSSPSPPASVKLGRDSFYSVWDMATGDALAHLHAMLTLTTLTEDAAGRHDGVPREAPAEVAGPVTTVWLGRAARDATRREDDYR